MRVTPTLCAAATGIGDTALFLGKRPALFRERPGRAAGSVVALGLWAALAAKQLTADQKHDTGALGLAAVLLVANVVVLLLHLRHGVKNPRVYIGVIAAAAATADTARRT